MARGSCCFYLSPASIEKQLTVNGSVCRTDIHWLQHIRGLRACAVLSQVHRCYVRQPSTIAAPHLYLWCVNGIKTHRWLSLEDKSHILVSKLHACLVTLNGALAKVQAKIFSLTLSHITSFLCGFLLFLSTLFPSFMSAFPHIKYIFSPITCSTIYPSGMFWCELQSFGALF